MKGKFITVEGIDGTGKSTLIPSLKTCIEDRGWEVALTTEPTDTWLGKNVKRGFTEEISPFTETFLFLADRCEHTKWVKAEMERGKIVLCDRYADSTYAYQGAALENLIEDPMDWLIEVSKHIVVEPDLTILLVAKPETVIRRIAPRGEWTKFERLEYLRKVNENYLKLAERFGRIRVVDAEQSADRVFEHAKNLVHECLGGRKDG
ncbi:MAG: dTMP kinase [Thermoplasmata archaeon]|nr:dTMP kinase [Thermoplasmata archaeon]